MNAAREGEQPAKKPSGWIASFVLAAVQTHSFHFIEHPIEGI